MGIEVSVNDGRDLAVEVTQAKSHVVKDSVADLFWKNTILLNAGGELDREKLHDQDGRWHFYLRLEVESQEVDNIWVAYLTEKVTLFNKSSNHVFTLA